MFKKKDKIEKLILQLKDENREIRWWSARALGDLGDQRAVPALIKALKDKYRLAREVAATALGKIGDKRAVPALIKALNDEDENVRLFAIEALGKIGDERAAPVLMEALHAKDKFNREIVARALGKIGDRQAIPDLIEKVLYDEDKDVCKDATAALAKIGVPIILDRIKSLRPEYEDVPIEDAAGTWDKIGDKQVVPSLIEVLDMEDRGWGTRAYAAAGLGYIKDQRAVPALVKALKDEEEEVRKAAKAALEKIKS